MGWPVAQKSGHVFVQREISEALRGGDFPDYQAVSLRSGKCGMVQLFTYRRQRKQGDPGMRPSGKLRTNFLQILPVPFTRGGSRKLHFPYIPPGALRAKRSGGIVGPDKDSDIVRLAGHNGINALCDIVCQFTVYPGIYDHNAPIGKTR